MRLAEVCGLCGSSRWCGRQCMHAPKPIDVETLKPPSETLTATVEKLSVSCAGCGEMFQPKRSTAKFCSSACRVKAHRETVADTH